MCYDANGNPVDVSDMHFHWTNGRMLDSITYTDDRGVEQPFMSFTYDDNGIRTSKTFGDTTTYYTNVDGAITSQYCLDEDGAVTDLMQFLYDGSNELLGFTYNGATYFYVKNLQGDVVAVIDSTGTEKAVYEYGAYGTLIHSDGDLADVNPMRYRGYYYDSDFGGYYLQSRYYAPEFAKFINSDLPEYAQQQKADHYGTNLFAYCCNDPVNNSDPTGTKVLGFGFQIAVSVGKITGGIEIVFYKSKGKWHRTSFAFGGATSNFSKSSNAAIRCLKAIKSGFDFKKLLSISATLSFLVIVGTKNTTLAKYKGWFSSASVTYKNRYFAGAIYSGKNYKVGTLYIGADSKRYSYSFSQTYYVKKPIKNISFVNSIRKALYEKIEALKFAAALLL